jgi:uroporphyrinogen-III decarboxylase
MMETGINGIETLDPPPLGTVELADAKRRLRDRLFIKGNVDPVNTILRKPRQEAARDVARTYEVGRQGGQFILSTACSVSPAAPRENVRLLAECVHGRL